MTMTGRRTCCRSATAGALIFCACLQAAAQNPEDTVQRFYAWALAHPSRALPSPAERVQLAKVLSPQLVALLKSAAETEAKCVRSTPKSDKPLLVEGDLFVGNYEGATEVVYGPPRRHGDTLAVESDLFYVDRRFPKAHPHRTIAWKDRVELRRIDGHWYVEDIRFARDRSLAASLNAYIEAGARSCR